MYKCIIHIVNNEGNDGNVGFEPQILLLSSVKRQNVTEHNVKNFSKVETNNNVPYSSESSLSVTSTKAIIINYNLPY